jgi:hypothetical protein
VGELGRGFVLDFDLEWVGVVKKTIEDILEAERGVEIGIG